MNEYDRQFRDNPQAITRNGETISVSSGYKSKRQIDRERKRAGKRTLAEATQEFIAAFLGGISE